MLLKILLCAYTFGTTSGRKIQDQLSDSIRLMWVAQGERPDFRTINRFRVNPCMAQLIKDCFKQFRTCLLKAELIDEKDLFIDGTSTLRYALHAR